MADLELTGDSLGHKHQAYNKLLLDAEENNKTVSVDEFNLDNSDLMNLINIDIANRNNNVEYILRVLTCDDMLYVSKALKHLDWLVKDQTYAHIVNAKYLRENVYPLMCSKAIIKFKKHIRDNLNDEKRAEMFYTSEENSQEAVKWLPSCGIQFIQENLTNHMQHDIKYTLLRRLCEKSITILEIYVKNNAARNKREALQANIFFLNSDIDKYLDLVEADDHRYPNFNKRATTVLMKKCSKRIIDKLDKYYESIHLPTFITCLKQENIKTLLLKQAECMKDNFLYRIFNLKRLLFFIKLMPHNIRFEFVKDVFIDRKHESKDILLSETERKRMQCLYDVTNQFHNYNEYIWYQFAPFDVAFEKIQNLITSVSSPSEKISMLEVVLTAAQNNSEYERKLLEYLRGTLKNAEYRKPIINKLLASHNFLRYDPCTWNILNEIFKSMDVYTEKCVSEKIIESVILYKLIHKENIPDIVEKKLNFNSLTEYHRKLAEDEKEMVFTYLYGLITASLAKCNTENETAFKEKIYTLEQVLKLLKNYKKELQNYPVLISEIKDLIKIKTDSSWNVDMGMLFNINKTWRKLLFEESLALYPTEAALLNALKHGPSLLEKNKNFVENMLCNDKMSLSHVLSKIRIYWPDSFAKNITMTYTEKLKVLGNHKATTRGLSMLLPRSHLKELVEKYIPKQAKVDWATIDEIELSVQQQFAKTIHNARPQPLPDTIIGFAKGDYLQYALPSLLSIFYNLNEISSRKFIPLLLDAPVSLQKHGIRLAVSKLEIGELLTDFSSIWKNNNNTSIRSVMFKYVLNALCNEKDSRKIQKTLELVEMFMDSLTFQEDKSVYKLLMYKVEEVPLEVRGKFYMKSFKFLHQFITSCDDEDYKHEFRTYFTAMSSELVQQLCPDFVEGMINEFVREEFTKHEIWASNCIITLIVSYLLTASKEQTQLERYHKICVPILKQSFILWDTIYDGDYFVRNNLAKLLNEIRRKIKQYVEDKKFIPSRIIFLMYEELSAVLTAHENYILLTKMKLTVAFVAILNTQNPIVNWKETCSKISTEFGNKCHDFLVADCTNYFPRVYILFVEALRSVLEDFVPDDCKSSNTLDICRCLVRNESFTPGYLAAIKLFSTLRPVYGDDADKEMKKKSKELREDILKHHSTEIKIHYFNQFNVPSH